MSAKEQLEANPQRYPKVMSADEIETMPRLEFNTGIDTGIFISQEREDARYFRQGVCYAKADHEPVHWTQSNFDEAQYCISGKIRLRVEDAGGKVVVLEARPGDNIYLPAGYTYTLEATGVEYTFLWTSGPSNRPGIVEAPGYSKQLRALR
jgi:ethanolamine utilization protein EutQ (cupin superfamily)